MKIARLGAVLSVALVPFLAPAAPLQAANPAYCNFYAAQAVKQQNKNLAWGCGYTGPRWMKNFGLHYAWCLGAPVGAVKAERYARASMLQACSGGGGGLTKTFVKPKYQGLRLDWCYTLGADCGAYAAKAYCVARGYPLVKGFGLAQNIGSFTKTRTIGSGDICSGPKCDGFSFIKCSQ